MEEAMECCTRNSSQFKQRFGVAHTSGVTAQDETTGCVPFPLSEDIFELRAITITQEVTTVAMNSLDASAIVKQPGLT